MLSLPFTKDLDADDICLCILYNSLNLILHEKGSSTRNKNKARLVCIDKHFGCWRPGDARNYVTTHKTYSKTNVKWTTLLTHIDLRFIYI